MIHSYKKRRYLNQCSQRVSGIKSSATPVVKRLERQAILKSWSKWYPKSVEVKYDRGRLTLVLINYIKLGTLNWSNLHRCSLPCVGSFGQAVSEEKIFGNLPTRNKNCLWQPCLLMDRDEMSHLYRGPSIDAPYQVSVHLAKQFQRRRLKCEK